MAISVLTITRTRIKRRFEALLYTNNNKRRFEALLYTNNNKRWFEALLYTNNNKRILLCISLKHKNDNPQCNKNEARK